SGQICWSLGDPHRIVFERSTTKPFKALALIRSGCADALDLDDGDLALIAGSHSGTAVHVTRAKELLKKAGLSEHDLKCAVRLPLGEDGLLDLIECGSLPTALHCDCSGEHIGALALCRHNG